MNRSWLWSLLGAAVLCALPGVSSAQYSPYYYLRSGSYNEPHMYSAPGTSPTVPSVSWGRYSPYYYLRSGSYDEPHMYSAPGTSPSNYRGSAAYLYGDSYSPYNYLRDGTYSMPLYYGYNTRFGNPAGEDQEVPANDTRAFIRVRVPANAEIWFEGDKTNQTGTERNFVSPALETDKSFTYDIRARWTDGGGKVVDKTQKVNVEAGRRSTVDFVSTDAKAKQ
jgi:uncharacterized protein (TIGR03000 family)